MVHNDNKMELKDTNQNLPFQLPPLPKKLKNGHQDSKFLPSLPALPLKSPTQKKTNKIDFLTDISDNLLVECRKLNSDNQKLKSRLKQKVRENEDLAEKINHQAIFSKKLEQEQQRLRDSNWSLETKLQDAYDEVSFAKSSNIKFVKELKLKTDQFEMLNREMENLKDEKLSLTDKISTLEGRSGSELEELKNMNSSLNEENELLHRQVNSLKTQLDQKLPIPDKNLSPINQSKYMDYELADTLVGETPALLNNLSTSDTIKQLRLSLMKIKNEKKELEDLLKTGNLFTEIGLNSDGSKILYPMQDSRSMVSCQWDDEIQNHPLNENYIHRSSSNASKKVQNLVKGVSEKEVAEFNDAVNIMEATQLETVSSNDGAICQLSDKVTFKKSCNQVSSGKHELLKSELLEVRDANEVSKTNLICFQEREEFLEIFVSKLQSDLKSAAGENENLAMTLLQATEEQKCVKDTNGIISAELSLLKESNNDLEKEILRITQENKQLTRELSAIHNETKSLTSEKISACELARNLETKLSDSEKHVLVLEPSISLLKEELKDVHASHSKSLEAKDTIINDLRMQLSKLELSFNELTADRKNILTKVQTLETNNANLQFNITTLDSEYQKTINELTVTKGIASELQQKLSEQMQVNSTLNADALSLKTQEEDLKCRISLLEVEKETLTKMLSSLEVSLNESQLAVNFYKDTIAKVNMQLKEFGKEHSSKDDFVLNLTNKLEMSERNNILLQSNFDQLKELTEVSSSKLIDLESQLKVCKIQIDTKDSHFLILNQEKEKLVHQLDESTRQLNEMKNTRDEQFRNVVELEKKQEDTISKYKSLQNEMMSLNQSLIENKDFYEKEKLNLVLQVSEIKRQDIELQHQVSNLTEQLKCSEREPSSLMMEGENVVPRTEREVALSQELIQEQVIDLEDEDEESDTQGRKSSILNPTSVDITDQNLSLERDASLSKLEVESLKKEVSKLEIARSDLQEDILKMTNQKLSLQRQNSSLESSNAELEVQLNLSQSKIAESEASLLNSKSKIPEYILKCMSVNPEKSASNNVSVALESSSADTESSDVVKDTGCKLESAIGDSQCWMNDYQQETSLLSKKAALLLLQQEATKNEREQVSDGPKIMNRLADEKHKKEEAEKLIVEQKKSTNEFKCTPVTCEKISTEESIPPKVNIDGNTSLLETKTTILGHLIDKFSTQEDTMIQEFNLSSPQNSLDIGSQESLQCCKTLKKEIDQLLMLQESSKSVEESTNNVFATRSEVHNSTKQDNELSIDYLKTVQPKGVISRGNQDTIPSCDDGQKSASISIPQIKYDRLTYELDLLKEKQKDIEKKYLDKIIDNKCCVVELDELQRLKECQNVNTEAFKELINDNNLLAISKKAYIATTVFKHPDPDNVVVLPITYYNKLTRSHEAVKKNKDREATDAGLDPFSSSLPSYHVREQSNVVHDPEITIARTLSPAVTSHTERTVNTNISLTNRNMMPLITQTVIGEYLYKYHRKLGILSSISESRHERYFWVHPYSMTLYWSDINPVLSNPSDNKVKALAITGVRSVDDNNPLPPGLYHKSIIVQSIERSIKITCASRQRHNIWLNSMKYLLARSTEDLEFDENPEISSMAIRVTAQDSAITRPGSFRHNLPRSRSVVHDRRLNTKSSIGN
ncbi:BA75_01043T0 [Komagataella pastoris]|uniref:BA75_01043T0 n=1 Tax=Komagataella pastoris TaxID=4922 RepID=A0A1B2J896_PICPA|nr:BA75_01043T0 [Komagataella pastoris]